MTPQEIADTAAALGFDITLDGDFVRLYEEVWVLDDTMAEDEVWERYVAIRTILMAKGLTLPFGSAQLGHDSIDAIVTPSL